MPVRAAVNETYIVLSSTPIPPNGTAVSQITVPNTGAILDVALGLQISHPNVSELTLRLIHPDGVTSVLLIDHRCGSGDGFNLGLDDEAATSISTFTGNCAGLLSGSYQPESPLSAFDGLSSAGTWTLEAQDTVAGTAGLIFQWSLALQYEVKAGRIRRCNTADVAIPDPGQAVSEIVSDDHVPLADLDLLPDVAHPEVGELAVAVRSPDATTVDVLQIAGSCEGFDVRLDDEAASPLPSSCNEGQTVTGTRQPANPLSIFDGMVPAGTWQLLVDDSTGGNTGTVEDWCIDFDFGIFRDGFEEFGDLRYWVIGNS